MNRTQLITVLVVAALMLVPAVNPVAAQEPPVVKLSLAECMKKAIDNNLDLTLAKKDPRIAENSVLIQESAFDSSLQVSGSYGKTKLNQTFSQTGSPSTDESSTTQRTNLGAAWGQKVTFGADYSLSLDAYETNPSPSFGIDRNTGLPVTSDNLYRGAGLTFQYRMPLLRGFGKEINTSSIILARNALAMSNQDLRGQANATLKQVEDAYWDLLATIKAVDVAKESLKLANDLLDLNRKKVEVGTLAPIEIVQAEAGVASREENVILAETAVANAEDNLRRLLAVPSGDPLWNASIVPTDQPEFRAREVALDAALSKALDVRPEIVNAKQRVSDSELSERVAKDAVRHSLELDVTAGTSKDKSQIRSQIVSLPSVDVDVSSDSPNWTVGLVYGFPIGNRAAKANYGIATLNREKSEIALRNVEQAIRVDVRTAVRNVESGVKRVQAANSNTILQRKTLEAEQKKFENGMSTSFEVLRIQTDLLNAQVSEIRAVLDYNKSLADLERAKGTLLEARGFALDAVQE